VAEALQRLPGAAFDDPTVSSTAQAFANATLGQAVQQHLPGLASKPLAAPEGAIGNCVAVTINATVAAHCDAHDEQPAAIVFVRSGGCGPAGGRRACLRCAAGRGQAR
jgi:hypothetical protein